MKTKRVLAVLLSSAMLLSMAACSNGGTASGTGASTANSAITNGETPDFSGTTMRFAWWGSQPRHDATIKVVEQYEALTGIDIEYEFYDFNGYFTQMDTLVAADDVWDVFQMGNNWATYYDPIEPLNSYMDSGIIDVSDINAPLLKVTQDYEGNQMGISLGTNARVWLYNPAIFEEAGLPQPTDNWTWDDFYTAATTIHDKLGIYAMDTVAYFDIVFAACAQMGEGYNLFSMDGSEFAIKDDVTAIAKMMDIFVDLMKSGAVADPGVQAEIVDVQADYICTGESAMLLLPSNQFVAVSQACAEGIELKLAPLPRMYADGQSGMLVRSSQMISMAKGSENKDAAAHFINYIINSTEANDVLAGERGVPINTTVRERLASNADAVVAHMYDTIDKISAIPDTANTSNAEPASQPEIDDVLQTYFEAYLAGEYSSGQECAEAFYAEAKEIFASY